MHPMKFVIMGRDGAYRFHLAASTGQVVLVSEPYTSMRGAEEGVESVKVNAAIEERYERRRSSKDEAYFVLKAANGAVIGTSEMYASGAAMENGIAAVRKGAPGAAVERWGEG